MIEQISVYKLEKINIKNKGEVIVLFGRNKDKKKVIKKSYGHEPYFYVTEDTIIPKHRHIVRVEDDYKSVFHANLKKIVTVNSDNVPGVRNLFNMANCYEDDVLYKLRWSLDTKIKNGVEFETGSDLIHYTDLKPIEFFIEPRRIHIDIEVMMGVGNKLPDYNNPTQPITSISNIDSYNKTITTFTIKNKDDLKLLKKLRVSSVKILYTIDNPMLNYEVCELETEIGTKYKWIIFLFKTELLVSFKDNTLSEIYYSEKVEFTMMNKFLNYFRNVDPDFFCGWNIDGFDLPYIVFRMKRLGVNYKKLSPINRVNIMYYKDTFKGINIGGVVVFDTMVYYLKLHTHKVSGALNDAANVKLGYGKVKYSGSLDNLYENDFKTFLKYNAVDVVMEYEIFEKMKMIEFYGGLKQFIGCPYEDMRHNSRIIDFFLLSKAKEAGYALPSARENKRLARELKLRKGKYSGGHVPIPVTIGRNFHVLTIDLKSLYPMIMLSWNLGNDTLLDTKISTVTKDMCFTPELPKGTGVLNYRTDILSFISKCLKELVDYRDVLKHKLFIMKQDKTGKYDDNDIELLDLIQKIIKFITNTIYGVLGYPNFRLFAILIAETITTIGRMVITDTIKSLDGFNILNLVLKVLYGDTDSAMTKIMENYSDLDKIPEKGRNSLINIFNKMCPEKSKKDFTQHEQILIGISYYITNKLNKMYEKYIKKFNVKKNYLLIKPEDISSVFFTVKKKASEHTAKKKYAKRVIIEFIEDKPIKVDKVDIKGFKKSNQSEVGRNAFVKVLGFICVDEIDQIVNENIETYLREIILNIINGTYTFLDLCRRVGMNQHINLYNNEEHVRAARWTNEHAHLWGGKSNYGKNSTVKYLFVDPDKIPYPYARTDVVAVDDNNYIPEQFMEYIDKKKIINKTIIEPMSEILDGLHIEIMYIKTGKKNKKLW